MDEKTKVLFMNYFSYLNQPVILMIEKLFTTLQFSSYKTEQNAWKVIFQNKNRILFAEKKLFTLKSIFYIRSLNGLRTREIFKYYRELKIASNYNVFQLFLFSIIPSLFFKILYRTYKKIKHL